MNNLKQYDEYVKAYNELADKLYILGASDEILQSYHHYVLWYLILTQMSYLKS